jgi:caa(3)-type oxidase subunit IV
MSHVNRKQYWLIFVLLAVLTGLELAVVKVPGIRRGMMLSALVLLAAAKAALVGLFFMHLKHETRVLRMTVLIPMIMPAIYALVLVAEAAWRLAT